MEELDIKTAIQIAKILAAAPDERIPMILDGVLDQTVFRGRNGTLKSRICGCERCHFFIHKTPPIAGA